MDPKVQINVEEWKSPESTSQRKKKVEIDYLIHMIHVGNVEEEILIYFLRHNKVKQLSMSRRTT